MPTDEVTPGTRLSPGAVAPPKAIKDPLPDWNPRGPRVRRDPVSAYDEMRSRCPVARGASGAWTLFSHADVTAAALDHQVFSNAVSRHLQVPNGLDEATHTEFRALVDRYFTRKRMTALEPAVQRVAAELVSQFDVPGPIDAVEVGARFAVRAQSAWLGWPLDLEGELLQWMADNHAATRSRDGARTAEVAQRFDAIIRSLIDARREAGDAAPDDVTTELLRDRVNGRELTDEEIVSILRIDDPFVANRRITTEPVTVGGRELAAGERVFLNWASANRDPQMFGDPDAFDPLGNAPYNLVYGIGKHVCPGRPLATLELRALTRAVLETTVTIEPNPDRRRQRALPPVGGFAAAPLRLR